jgi:hypothetical protein
MNPIKRDKLNDQCLDEFVKYVFSICKRSPTAIDLKRYLVKVEIDQQIAIKHLSSYSNYFLFVLWFL